MRRPILARVAIAACCFAGLFAVLFNVRLDAQPRTPPASQKPPAKPTATPPTTKPSAEPAGTVTAPQVRAAIEQLGSLDFPIRSTAARTVRRADPPIAVPALLQAVRQHKDEYIRFKALVLLSGFNDPRTRDVMIAAVGDKNDRMRSVAYAYFEYHPEAAVAARLLEALKTEESEFVRPVLTRALAAHASDPKVRQRMEGLVMQGQAFYRSVVIEALGDHKAAYAVKNLVAVAQTEGPLQDDAALALGKIGDKSVLAILAGLQRSVPRESQPSVAAAICLLGVNCASHQPFVVESLRFAVANLGFQTLVRSSASALATLAAAGSDAAAVELVTLGAPTRDPERAPIALALGTLALRNTPLLLRVLEAEPVREPAIELLREAFDMLEEDYEEERFFVAVRRAYWQAPAKSSARIVADTLVRQLEF